MPFLRLTAGAHHGAVAELVAVQGLRDVAQERGPRGRAQRLGGGALGTSDRQSI